MRLIDADALIAELNTEVSEADKRSMEEYGVRVVASEYGTDYGHLIKKLLNAPTIEPSGDLISRTDAIERVELITKCEWDNNVIYRDEVIDALKFAPSADRPTLTEEVREAIMRLTMCAREECDICKFGHNHDNDCNFSKQVNRATENMNTILNAFKSADRPMGEWIPLEYIDGMATNFPYERDGEWVIVTDGKCISVERIKKDAYDHFYPNGRWFELEDVVAWMPLPKPYRMGEKE